MSETSPETSARCEELAQEAPGGRRGARVVLQHDPGGPGVRVGRVGVVLVQVVAADPDPAYGVRSSARRGLEQPALRVVVGPVLLEEDDEATDGRADAGQRDRRQALDLGRLARDELVEPRVERAAVAQHRFAGAHDGGEGHVVIGVDVAPVDAVLVGPVTRGEPQPPPAALGQREPDPAHAGQGDEVREQAAGDVVDR